MSRAENRHQRDRSLKKTERLSHLILQPNTPEPKRKAWVRRTYKHRKTCSCSICGNPRRTRGEITIQERKAPKIHE